jgi:hypothetical protein
MTLDDDINLLEEKCGVSFGGFRRSALEEKDKAEEIANLAKEIDTTTKDNADIDPVEKQERFDNARAGVLQLISSLAAHRENVAAQRPDDAVVDASAAAASAVVGGDNNDDDVKLQLIAMPAPATNRYVKAFKETPNATTLDMLLQQGFANPELKVFAYPPIAMNQDQHHQAFSITGKLVNEAKYHLLPDVFIEIIRLDLASASASDIKTWRPSVRAIFRKFVFNNDRNMTATDFVFSAIQALEPGANKEEFARSFNFEWNKDFAPKDFFAADGL